MAAEYLALVSKNLTAPELTLDSPVVWVLVGLAAVIVFWTIKR